MAEFPAMCWSNTIWPSHGARSHRSHAVASSAVVCPQRLHDSQRLLVADDVLLHRAIARDMNRRGPCESAKTSCETRTRRDISSGGLQLIDAHSPAIGAQTIRL